MDIDFFCLVEKEKDEWKELRKSPFDYDLFLPLIKIMVCIYNFNIHWFLYYKK